MFPATVPPAGVVTGHLTLRRLCPEQDSVVDKRDRLTVLSTAVRLFSVPGLFQAIVDHEDWGREPVENLLPVPYVISTITEQSIAKWAATCGISDESLAAAQHAAQAGTPQDEGHDEAQKGAAE